MISELSFLIDLLLNHKLQKVTKDLITARIKEVEGKIDSGITAGMSWPVKINRPTPENSQAASTLANLQKHELPIPEAPIANIAQTVATSKALDSRQQAIEASQKGLVDPRTGTKRKF